MTTGPRSRPRGRAGRVSDHAGGTPGALDDLAAVLHAAAAHPGQAEQLDLFGRFAGAWDIDWHGTGQDGKPATMTG